MEKKRLNPLFCFSCSKSQIQLEIYNSTESGELIFSKVYIPKTWTTVRKIAGRTDEEWKETLTRLMKITVTMIALLTAGAVIEFINNGRLPIVSKGITALTFPTMTVFMIAGFSLGMLGLTLEKLNEAERRFN